MKTTISSKKEDSNANLHLAGITGAIIRKRIFAALITLLSCANPGFIISSPNSGFVLEMNGRILQAKESESGNLKNLDSSVITVTDSKQRVIEVAYSNTEGICHLRLPLEKSFTISVSKGGWVTKKIEVNTKIGNGALRSYKLNFKIDLYREIRGLNVSVLKHAAARVNYDEYLNMFNYTGNENPEIALEIRKLHEDYFRLCSGKSQYVKQDNEMKEMVYKVQIITLAGTLPPNAKFFRKCGIAEEHKVDNKYVYTIGAFRTLLEAEQKAEELRSLGYMDAFTVAYINGRIIKMESAGLSMNR